MTLETFGSLIAFDAHDDMRLAFHTEKLELAKISPEAFQVIKRAAVLSEEQSQDPIFKDLTDWSNQVNAYKPGSNLRKVDHVLINNTQICNLKCVYCAAGGDGTFGDPVVKISIEKTLPQIRFFINKLESGDVFRINFMGGEPLLQPDVMEAIFLYASKEAIACNVQIKIVVTTNGTCLGDLEVALLKKMRATVNVSIDGSSSVNDLMRSQKNGLGSTLMVEKGLTLLLKAKSELSGIYLTAVFSEMHTDVLDTYEYFRQFDVDGYEFNFSHTEFSTKASENFSASLIKTFERAWNLGGESALLKIKSIQELFNRLDRKYPVTRFCGKGSNLLVIDARNQFYECPWDVGNAAQLVKYPIPEIETVSRKFLPNCQSCWMQNLCGGGCDFIHSRAGGMDKNFCNRMKSLIQSAFIYYERSRRV